MNSTLTNLRSRARAAARRQPALVPSPLDATLAECSELETRIDELKAMISASCAKNKSSFLALRAERVEHADTAARLAAAKEAAAATEDLVTGLQQDIQDALEERGHMQLSLDTEDDKITEVEPPLGEEPAGQAVEAPAAPRVPALIKATKVLLTRMRNDKPVRDNDTEERVSVGCLPLPSCRKLLAWGSNLRDGRSGGFGRFFGRRMATSVVLSE